jgi:hypothetical protein
MTHGNSAQLPYKAIRTELTRLGLVRRRYARAFHRGNRIGDWLLSTIRRLLGRLQVRHGHRSVRM